MIPVTQITIIGGNVELYQNKTKYTMDPGIYYSLEADEDNTNRY